MRVHTFSNTKVRGWDGQAPHQGLEHSRALALEDFCAAQPDDRMAVAYEVPGESAFPRLNLSAATVLADHGMEPQLQWIILDVDNPAHTPWASPEAARAAATRLDFDAGTLATAGIYSTRAGFRLLWHLEPSLPVSRANGFLAAWVDKVAKETGLLVDERSAEWTRLFRLPRAKRDGQVLEPAVLDLSALAPLDPWATGLVPEATTLSAGSSWGSCPEAPLDLSPEQQAAAWAHPWAQEGRPVPPDEGGHTYDTLKRSMAAVAAAGGIVDAHVLMSIFWESVLATPGRTMAEAWKLAGWVADREAANSKELDAAMDAGIPTASSLPEVTSEMWRAVEPYFRGKHAPLFSRLRAGVDLSRTKSENLPKLLEAARLILKHAEPPSPKALYAMLFPVAKSCRLDTEQVWTQVLALYQDARTASADPAKMAKAWAAKHPVTIAIVGSDQELYQLDTSRSPPSYIPAGKSTLLMIHNRVTRPGLPDGVDIDFGALPLPDILNNWGAWAERVEYVSGFSGTKFDRSRRVLQRGVHVLAAKEAAFDEKVDAWLRVLGASDPERFLDWLACVTYTQDQPLSAVYLANSVPGAGKSLFLEGLASLWGRPRTDYGAVNADFNGALLDSPIIAADEGITLKPGQEGEASERFRNLVANNTHPVRQKFMADATLNGALRVVVTANDDKGIPFRKALSQNGLDAVAQRIMFLETSPEAAQMLRDYGGRRGLVDWVLPGIQPGRIARHILWLRDNRKVEPGSRFLVEGRMTDWHREFAASQGIKPDILHILSKMVLGRKAERPDAAGVWMDAENGLCYVQASRVHDMWTKFSTNRRPSLNDIIATMKMVAAGDQERKSFAGVQIRVWPVRLQTLVDAGLLEPHNIKEDR